MSYREEDILFETEKAWVLRKVPNHFEVYKIGLTHSTRHGIFHNIPGALDRAIEHAKGLSQ